jgi:hypothetical protein
MLLSLKYLSGFLYVSGVTQFILTTLFAGLFVQYYTYYSYLFYISVVYNTIYEYWRRFLDFR